jgi:serine/threonine-protein kinase
VENAVTVFKNALEKDPNFAAGYAGLGEAYWRKYQLVHDANLVGQATSACRQAEQRDSTLSEAHTCLGLVYQGAGNYEQAVAEYQIARRQTPTLDAAQAGLAKAYESLNHFDDAEKAYRAAIALRPNYWAGYNSLGTFYLRRGRLDEAGQMYTQVISLVPDSFIGYSNLGITRVLQGRYSEAIPPLEHSLEIRKTGDAMSNLGTAYFQSRRYADAARVFEDAAALDAGQYEIWGNLGDAYYWAPSMRAQAAAAYERAISLGEARRKINPRDANMLSYLAAYYAMLGKAAPAEQRISAALRIAPRDPEVLYYSALVYTQLGQRARAIAALQRAVALGYSASTIRDTPNFEPLHEDPKFAALVSFEETGKGKTP